MEIANIFWHGRLTKFEEVCIKSFVNNGFYVKLWSYNNLCVEGVESCDARLVLPEEHLTKYKQRHFNSDESKEFYASIAAFSDAFRWNVINKFGGWWFDADCFCLKSSDDFYELRKNKSFVSGLQDSDCPSVACGAFYANEYISSKLIDRFNEVCKTYNYNFPVWGSIGPSLMSDVVQQEKLFDGILSPEMFYSIESPAANLFVNPDLKQNAKEYIVDSYLTHIWHSWMNVFEIDKDNPPKGSLLEELYNGTYTKSPYKNKSEILKYEISLQRYKDVSHLYKKILKRCGDVPGIGNYVRTQLPIEEIEIIFLKSEEYANIKI